jgi:phospholipid/cholesterol/gamma-HCH transport system ATP-binding protein
MSTPFLKITGLEKSFGDKVVLGGIDLEAGRASVTTVIGKSGIGKSVLLKCVAGLIDPDGGTIELEGEPIARRRRNGPGDGGFSFSYMFQNNALFDSLSAAENIALPLLEGSRLKKRAVAERVGAMLERLGLADARDRFPGELSGGMKKRVAFARALVTEPRVVLFDEPTTGLDPERKFSVFEMISKYREDFGFTALLVSHDIPEVFRISDRVAWLDEGVIKFFGTPDEVDRDLESALSGFLDKANYGREKKDAPEEGSAP